MSRVARKCTGCYWECLNREVSLIVAHAKSRIIASTICDAILRHNCGSYLRQKFSLHRNSQIFREFL